MFQSIVRVRMAPKKDTNGKEKRNGKVMMFYERQKNYLKRKRNQKKERLKYLLKKKTMKLLSRKEQKELKQLQEDMKKK